MSLIVNTNVGSLNAQRSLAASGAELKTAMERLSSGKKINSAADDAAGFAIAERMTAQIEGDFVFFLIGLKVNVWWKIHKWLPLLKTMPAMLKELDALPAQETGFLGYTSGGAVLSVQYWRSFAHLEAYAKSQEHAYFPVWRAFNKRMKHSRGDVGILH